MSLQSQLDTKRTMLDALQANLRNIEDIGQVYKKKCDDDWRIQNLKDSIVRCQGEIYEIERQIIAMRKGK